MADRAKITSADALEDFRASLLVYLSKVRPALEEMSEEARQTRAWIEYDRLPFWLAEARRRKRALEDARQELFSAELRNKGESKAFQKMAVERALHAFRETEEKLVVIRRWIREFENLSAPLVKQIDQVHWMVSTDLKQATVYLGRVVEAVEAYAQLTPAEAASQAPMGNPGSVETTPPPAVPAANNPPADAPANPEPPVAPANIPANNPALPPA